MKKENLVETIEKQSEEFLKHFNRIIGYADCELSQSQYRVMLAIKQMSKITIGDLSEIIGSSHSGTSEIVSRLVKLNLVEKQKDKNDSRFVLAKLTEKGQLLVNKHKETIHQAYQKLLRDMSEQDQNNFLDSLQTLNKILTNLKY